METQKGFVSLLGGRHHSSCAIAAALMQAARKLGEGDDHGRIEGAPLAREARISGDATDSRDFTAWLPFASPFAAAYHSSESV